MDSLDRDVEVMTYTAHRATRSHAPTLRASPISQDHRSETAAATTHRRSAHAAMEAHRSVAARAQTAEAETAMAAEATAHSEAVANRTPSYTAQQQNI